MDTPEDAPAKKLVKLSVTIDEAEFDRDIDKAFRTIAREVKLPGFRQGKVPRKVLEARIGLAAAREQALRDAVPQYLANAVREHDVDLIATPNIEFTGGQESGPVAFDATCEVRPEITVPGYGGLRVELPSPSATAGRHRRGGRSRAAPAGLARRRRSPGRSPATRSRSTLAASATASRSPGSTPRTGCTRSAAAGSPPGFDGELLGASAGDELTFTATPNGTNEPADFTVDVVQGARDRCCPS